jgi:hypothetical protein
VKCLIIAHVVSDGRLHGASVGVFRCQTHDMPVDRPSVAEGLDPMCPIGRIEQATEEALARIAAAAGISTDPADLADRARFEKAMKELGLGAPKVMT